MPITITAPTAGGLFGPGTLLSASSDFDFASNPGFEWWLAVSTEAGVALRERYVLVHSSPLSQNFLSHPKSTGIDQDVSKPAPAPDEAISLILSITNGGIVAQEATTQARWNPTFTLGLQDYLIAQSQTSGGLTAEQAQQLSETHAATQAGVIAMDSGLPLVDIPLGQFFRAPPAGLLRRAETLRLSGSGSLLRVQGVNRVTAYGSVYDFDVIPAGFGFTSGHVQEYERRLAQFSVVYKDPAGNETPDVVVDAHNIHGFMRWDGTPFPERVDYDIAPGCECLWTWLVFIASP